MRWQSIRKTRVQRSILRAEREKARLERWHWWFAWRPTMANDGTVFWFEGVARQGWLVDNQIQRTLWLRRSYYHMAFSYKPWEEHVKMVMKGEY